jgi:hypothetical protein
MFPGGMMGHYYYYYYYYYYFFFFLTLLFIIYYFGIFLWASQHCHFYGDEAVSLMPNPQSGGPGLDFVVGFPR